MLTVVVAVLFAIAVGPAQASAFDTPFEAVSLPVRLGVVALCFFVGLWATIIVLRSALAALSGGILGAALGAALPMLLWHPNANDSVMTGSGVLLLVGGVLGALRLSSASARAGAHADFSAPHDD
ncbi:MAG: hypothetical protein R3C10_04450 [Pirellulales bacterium]